MNRENACISLKLMDPGGKEEAKLIWIAIATGGGGEELLLMLLFFLFFYLELPLLLLVLMMMMPSRRSCDCHDYKTRDEYQIWVPQMEFMLLLNNNDCKERKAYHVNGDDGCNFCACIHWVRVVVV